MKILNLGSLNIDKTYSVKRFVQPKETIQALDYEEFCGGKGLNQSVALARAGAEVYHAGAVGGDGRILLDMLKEAGADTGYVETLDGAQRPCGDPDRRVRTEQYHHLRRDQPEDHQRIHILCA